MGNWGFLFAALLSQAAIANIALVDTDTNRSYLLFKKDKYLQFRQCQDYSADPHKSCEFEKGVTSRRTVFKKTQPETLDKYVLAAFRRQDKIYSENDRQVEIIGGQIKVQEWNLKGSAGEIEQVKKRQRDLDASIAMIEGKLTNPSIKPEEKTGLQKQRAKLDAERAALPAKLAALNQKHAVLQKEFNEKKLALTAAQSELKASAEIVNKKVANLLALLAPSDHGTYTNSEAEFDLLVELLLGNAANKYRPQIPAAGVALDYGVGGIKVEVKPGLFDAWGTFHGGFVIRYRYPERERNSEITPIELESGVFSLKYPPRKGGVVRWNLESIYLNYGEESSSIDRFGVRNCTVPGVYPK